MSSGPINRAFRFVLFVSMAILLFSLAHTDAVARPLSGSPTPVRFDLDDFPLTTPPAGMGIVQALAYITLVASAGLLWFRAFIVGHIDAANIRIAGVMAVITTLLHIILIPYIRVWEVGDSSMGIFDPEAWRVSPWASSIRGVLMLVIGFPIQQYFARKPVTEGKNRWWVFLGGMIALGSLTVVGHTANLDPTWLTHGADFVHGVGAAFWFGGLLGLVRYLRDAFSGHRPDAPRISPLDAGAVLSTFSSMALFAVIALAASGVVMALKVGGTPPDIVETPFGKTLIVKLLILLIPLALAIWNRYKLLPALGRSASDQDAWGKLRTSVRVELLALTVLLGVTGFLVLQNPVN